MSLCPPQKSPSVLDLDARRRPSGTCLAVMLKQSVLDQAPGSSRLLSRLQEQVMIKAVQVELESR